MTDNADRITLDLDPAERALFVGRAEQARMLHILADRVLCGCADIGFVVTYDPLTPNDHPGEIKVSMRACVKRDHEREWPRMGRR